MATLPAQQQALKAIAGWDSPASSSLGFLYCPALQFQPIAIGEMSAMQPIRAASVSSMVLLGALLGCLPAHAATARIGAVEEIAAGAPQGTPGGSVIQLAGRAGSRSFAVPPGFGVITSWSHRTGTNGGTLRFRVYRPTGNGDEFLTLASTARTVTAGALHSFPVAIKVKPGDRLGLSTDDRDPLEDSVNVAYGGEAGDQMAILAREPAEGTTFRAGTPGEYRAAVAAVVETDADGDGRGDDSQDDDDDNDGIPDSLDYPPPHAADDDNDRISNANEAKLGTDPLDRDSDDDGLADGSEDRNRDGRKGRRETSARRRDTDRDKLTDGLERGVRKPIADPPGRVRGTNRRKFRKDRDPRTKTSALKRDSDGDRLSDGREDKNRNGRRDRGETNPKSKDSDGDGASDKRDSKPLARARR